MRIFAGVQRRITFVIVRHARVVLKSSSDSQTTGWNNVATKREYRRDTAAATASYEQRLQRETVEWTAHTGGASGDAEPTWTTVPSEMILC